MAALHDKRPNLVQLGESKPFPMGLSSAANITMLSCLGISGTETRKQCIANSSLILPRGRGMLLGCFADVSPNSGLIPRQGCATEL